MHKSSETPLSSKTSTQQQYFVSDDLNLLDRHFVHQQISATYWAKDIPFETMNKAIDNSLCFGIYDNKKQQVGFARMITDKATFAYLADVFINTGFQKLGLSKLLMHSIQAHPDLQRLRRQVLATADAHGLYQQFGFKALASPETFMEIWQPNVYQQSP